MTCWIFLWWYVSAMYNCSRPGSWQCGIMWVTDLRTSSHVTLLCDNSVYLIQQQLQHNLKHSEILFHPPSHTLGHTHPLVWVDCKWGAVCEALDCKWSPMDGHALCERPMCSTCAKRWLCANDVSLNSPLFAHVRKRDDRSSTVFPMHMIIESFILS